MKWFKNLFKSKNNIDNIRQEIETLKDQLTKKTDNISNDIIKDFNHLSKKINSIENKIVENKNIVDYNTVDFILEENLNKIETKKCSKCGKELPFNLFSKSKYGKNGLRADCKNCQSIYAKNLKKRKLEDINEQFIQNNNQEHRNGKGILVYPPNYHIESCRLLPIVKFPFYVNQNGKDVYYCPFTHDTFNNLYSFKKHIRNNIKGLSLNTIIETKLPQFKDELKCKNPNCDKQRLIRIDEDEEGELKLYINDFCSTFCEVKYNELKKIQQEKMDKKVTCLICNEKYHKDYLSSHIENHHGINSQRYYDMFLKKEGEGFCKCGCGSLTEFKSINSGYKSFASNCKK